MGFKISAMAVMIFGLMMATALAADVDGEWFTEGQGRDGKTIRTTFIFKAEGTTLTGTRIGLFGENAIEEGKIDGNNISFVHRYTLQGITTTMRYKGTIAGDEIRLTMDMEGGMGDPEGKAPRKLGGFTLKRAAE
jgi:hypothetical protein